MRNPVTLAVVAVSLAITSCHVSDEGNPSADLETAVGGESSGSPAPTPAEVAHDLPRSATPLEVGASVQPFRLSTATETLDSANALRAGPLVLVFYIGDFCIYCQRQLDAIQARLEDFRRAGATVWAISADAPSTSAALARSHHIDFPLPSDQELNVVRMFGVESAGSGVALPSVFVVSARSGEAGGTVTYRHVGANQSDRASVDDMLAAARAAASHQ